MKKAVQFGAGKIGRGFIGELLHDSGYEVTYLDTFQPVVDELQKDKQFYLFTIEKDFEEKLIDHVDGLSSINDQEEAADRIADADLITTSVMATNLPKIAPLLATGLKKRLDKGLDKTTVMACENAMMGSDILRDEVIKTGILTEEEADQAAAWVNTAVDRMVFDGEHNGHKGIEVGQNYELAVEEPRLINPDEKPLVGAHYVDDLNKFLQRKIFTINGGHAMTGYFGQQAGFDIVQDALRDEKVQAKVRAAVGETAKALEQEYGFTPEDMDSYIQAMLIDRFTTPGVTDEITRVCREPLRKLSSTDRIVGPLLLCEKYGIDAPNLVDGVVAGLRYQDPNDEQTVKMHQMIDDMGIEDALVEITGLEKGSKLYNQILEAYQK